MKKFVAFGCKNSNSTHSYIHYAYQRAFESLGWESHWIDNQDADSFDFSNSLILTLGGWDSKLPVLRDCKYILHNCDVSGKYHSILDNSLILQVFTKHVLDRNVEKIDDCIYYQNDKEYKAHVLYQPWATDFLPDEISELDSLNFSKEKVVNWVGSVWNDSGQGNSNEIFILKNYLESKGIEFKQVKTDYSDNKKAINESYISPSLQGKWQCENGYIPCRIFKNISYGEFGITNSEFVSDLFQGMIVYDSDIEIMVEKALRKREDIKLSELNSQIRFVKEKHTYVNRVKNILSVI